MGVPNAEAPAGKHSWFGRSCFQVRLIKCLKVWIMLTRKPSTKTVRHTGCRKPAVKRPFNRIKPPKKYI